MKAIAACFLATVGLACDGGTDEHEHEFTNYAQCYNHHTVEEGVPAQEALTECDEALAITHDDLAHCQAYYTDYADVPTAEADAHCATLFPTA